MCQDPHEKTIFGGITTFTHFLHRPPTQQHQRSRVVGTFELGSNSLTHNDATFQKNTGQCPRMRAPPNNAPRGASPCTATASYLSGALHARLSWAAAQNLFLVYTSLIDSSSPSSKLCWQSYPSRLSRTRFACLHRKMRAYSEANTRSCQLTTQRGWFLRCSKLVVTPSTYGTSTTGAQDRRKRVDRRDPNDQWCHLGKDKPNCARPCLQDEVKGPGTPYASETFHPGGFM